MSLESLPVPMRRSVSTGSCRLPLLLMLSLPTSGVTTTRPESSGVGWGRQAGGLQEVGQGGGPTLLFNNDLTNIESCSSPFHKGTATTGQPFTLAMLHASVQETAGRGFAIHELAPGCCYVPWWQNSTLTTIPEHVAWWTHTFFRKDGTLPPNRTEGYMEHLMRGGDILGPFIRYTRAAGMKAFVSWRMADSQAFSSFAERPLEDQFKDTARFWYLLRAMLMSLGGFVPPFFDRFGPFFRVLVPVS